MQRMAGLLTPYLTTRSDLAVEQVPRPACQTSPTIPLPSASPTTQIPPDQIHISTIMLTDLIITEYKICRLFSRVNARKASGPDGIPGE